MNRWLWVVTIAAFIAFVAGDVLLWLAVGWVSSGQPQAAMIAAACALPVALVGIVGSMLGAWRTHVGLLDRERLVRFQAEKLDSCVKVLTFADEYPWATKNVDELVAKYGHADAESNARQDKILRDLLYARAMLAVLCANQEVNTKAKKLADDVLDKKSTNESRPALVAAVQRDLRL